MTNERLAPANVTIWAAYPEAFADLASPTVAEMNNTDMVFNISCAIADDYTLNPTDSDTDDSRTICDEGDVQNLTFENFEAMLNSFRDADLAAPGVFNKFFELFKAKGCPYVLIKRLGKNHSEPAVLDDVLSFFRVETDHPSDEVDDTTNIMFGARFIPKGEINNLYKLVA